jgi:hypothetical protein
MATTKKKSAGTKRASTTQKSTKGKAKATRSKSVAKRSAKSSKSAVATKPIVAEKKVEKRNEVKVAKAEKEVKPKRVFDKFKNLRKWNIVMALLHLAQGIAVVLLSKDVLYPVTTNYLTLDPLASANAPVLVPATRNLFDINVAYIVAAFFFMSAIAHGSIATWYRKRYEANLEKGINKGRWIEYSLSASTMIVAIAMIAGIYDLSTLLMMFGLTAVMNLCGLVMELANNGKEQIDWTSYIVGCIAGILPWAVYAFYVYGSAQYGEGGGPPNFVYAILVSIFLFFNVFALNMWLQYNKKGKWADYLYGEKAYIILSLVAKSALAWQVFAGTLRP